MMITENAFHCGVVLFHLLHKFKIMGHFQNKEYNNLEAVITQVCTSMELVCKSMEHHPQKQQQQYFGNN